MRQLTSAIQPAEAAAAISSASRLNSGLKPGASFSAFLASQSGQPVCLATQPSQMNAAQVVSVMTENQSTELIALRFMVGRPNAARIAKDRKSTRLNSSH